MRDFTLLEIKDLVNKSLREEPTGNDWLDSRYQEQVHWVGHTQPYYRAFYLIAQALKPALTVELGSWQATAAAHFACGNPHGQVITIDCHKDDKNAQKRAIEAAQNCANLTYVNAWTIEVNEFAHLGIPVFNPASLPRPIDILFIDARHEWQYASREKETYFPLLADTALVICDDLADQGGSFPGMNRFWDEMDYEKFAVTSIHLGIPMGFALFKREKQNTDERRKMDVNREVNQPGPAADTRPLVEKPRRGKPRKA